MNPNTEQLIDVALWDRAKWKGTVFGARADGPPLLALAYENGDAGREIFRGLQARLGVVDQDELLRIAVIEGDIPGREPGYTIHIHPRIETLVKGMDSSSPLLTVHRFQRMTPQPASPHLSNFKKAYAQHGRFWLMSAELTSAGGVSLGFEHQIGKTQIEFRLVTDIKSDQDIDSTIFVRESFGPKH
jgi:hypothetical protein